jgi:hypothetical protein
MELRQHDRRLALQFPPGQKRRGFMLKILRRAVLCPL